MVQTNESSLPAPRSQNRKSLRRRRRPLVATTATLAMAATATIPLLFFLGSNPNHLARAQSQEPQCKPQEPTQYDWERFNYYELLGLTDENDSDDYDYDSKDNGTKKKKKKKKKRGSNSKGGGLSIQELGGISNKEIRKAYRKQAQKYHPDKQASKKKSSGNATNTDSKNKNNNNNNGNNNNTAGSLSIEESNARFAKIAEAYEFLTDETKRKDYDLFLEYCQNTEIVKDNEENEGRLSTILKKRFSGLFDDFVASRDPFRVFEEFLFGANDDDDDDDEWGDSNGYFDPNDPFSHLRYTNQQRPDHNSASARDNDPYYYPPPDEDPVRVFNEQRTMYDPSTGENVVRVLQTEEFAPPRKGSNPSGNPGSTRGANASSSSSSSSSFYYRIVAQDFKERYDPYSAREVYVPITEPYLQEEGHRTSSGVPKHPSETSSSSIRNNGSIESILHPWQVLTPSSRLMTSPNKKYVAGLSPDCELLVMRNRQEDGDDKHGNHGYAADDHEIVWSTQRAYGNNGYASNHCFAFLKGPHLVVTVGQHPHETNGMGGNSRILWHSDGRSDDRDSTHGYYEYEDEFGFWHKRQRTYLAQLDNDGALSVYSVWNVPQDQPQQSSAFPSVASRVFLDAHGNRRRKPTHRHHREKNPFEAKTLAADAVFRALLAAEDFFHGRIDASREYGHLYSSGTSLTYKRCVSSTSRPFGCNRLGRKVTRVSLEVYWKMRRILLRINHLADAWLDLIYEEDDIFYVWKESIWKNTNAFGSKMAALQARWVRKLLEKARALSDSLASSTKQQQQR